MTLRQGRVQNEELDDMSLEGEDYGSCRSGVWYLSLTRLVDDIQVSDHASLSFPSALILCRLNLCPSIR